MFRSLLIIILGGLLMWLILRLSRTLQDAVPRRGEADKSPTPLENDKIIDAEFEDINDKSESKDS
jgi:hypothetical protein